MENIKFYIDFFGGGDAEKAWQELKVCNPGKERWGKWVSEGNDPFAFVPPDGWGWLKKAAVSHPNATTEMLLKGVMDEHWEVRYAAVLHLNATKEVLAKVAEDKDEDVREAAARNPNYGKFLNN
jgi:hypothetical protein